MSDAEWAICEALAGKGGRPSAYCTRDNVDGIRYFTQKPV
jgi:hypothetical protein